MPLFQPFEQNEREESLAKKRDLIQAYNRDALGSYDRAEQRAYDNALPSNAILGKRLDYQFIQKVRNIAAVEFDNQKRKENDELEVYYNLHKTPDSAIGHFTDMPVRITDALGRDLGRMAGETVGVVASGASFILGKDSALNTGVTNADRYVTAAIDDITRIVTESPWIEKKIKNLRDKANKPLDLKDINSFMGGVNVVFATHFRKIMGDLADILDEWWNDPRTLCCLIKTLSALAMASAKKMGKGESFSSNYNKFIKNYNSGHMNISELTGTREFFDKMISILKIIRDFLNQSLNLNFALNLDLGLSMSKASLGALMALLTALQQMLEDKIYSEMMRFVKKEVREEIRQCIPFEKLLRMLADWMTGPDGIFKYIEQFIDAYMLGFQTNMQFGFDRSVKNKMMDLAALDKLIRLLEKMRDAMLNLELCLEADFNKTPELSDDGLIPSERRVGIGPTNYSDLVDQMQKNERATGNRVIYPTDTEIKAFIVNRLGESDAFANQVLTSAKASSDLNVGRATGSPDNAGGGDASADLRMAIGDCARTLNSQRIEELAKLIADWEII